MIHDDPLRTIQRGKVFGKDALCCCSSQQSLTYRGACRSSSASARLLAAVAWFEGGAKAFAQKTRKRGGKQDGERGKRESGSTGGGGGGEGLLVRCFGYVRERWGACLSGKRVLPRVRDPAADVASGTASKKTQGNPLSSHDGCVCLKLRLLLRSSSY